MNSYRQGDVLLVKVDSIPSAAKEIERKGDVVLAFGEVTGHAHRIKADPESLRVFDFGAERYLKAVEAFTVEHEEHGAIVFEAGVYRQAFQVEDFGMEVRRVAD